MHLGDVGLKPLPVERVVPVHYNPVYDTDTPELLFGVGLRTQDGVPGRNPNPLARVNFRAAVRIESGIGRDPVVPRVGMFHPSSRQLTHIGVEVDPPVSDANVGAVACDYFVRVSLVDDLLARITRHVAPQLFRDGWIRV